MSIDDEQVVRERLDRAFEAIVPRPAPVGRAVERGKAIRVRRRVAAVAGLAVAVAAGVLATPALRHWQAAPAPATPTNRYTVTVQMPGPHSPAGLIASGTVNGKRWQLTASRPGADGAGRGNELISASGPAFGPDGTTDSFTPVTPGSTEPVSLDGLSGGPTQVQFGTVRADVSSVRVRLGNGTVLTLRPVTLYGVRVVAFAAPLGAVIVDATAYSPHGEIATAVPFDGSGGLADFVAWLKPGQRGLPRATARIGSGTFGGRAWSAVAYQGPWGICIEVSGGSDCTATTFGSGTKERFFTVGSPGVFAGTASASVVRILVERPDGTSFQVRPVTIGIQRFFAFPLNAGHKPWRWTAYDGSGHVIASSQVTPSP